MIEILHSAPEESDGTLDELATPERIQFVLGEVINLQQQVTAGPSSEEYAAIGRIRARLSFVGEQLTERELRELHTQAMDIEGNRSSHYR